MSVLSNITTATLAQKISDLVTSWRTYMIQLQGWMAGTALGGPSSLPAPVQNAPTTSTTGGTLAAGTYYYQVTALTSGLSAPTQNTPASATTGGALAANTYYYKVTATNANGETLASAEQSIVTTGATSKVTLSWGAVAGATGYRVYRGTAANGENVFYNAGNGISFVDTGLAATTGSPPATNTTGAGETTPSNEVSITTTGTTSSNTLSWGAVAGASGYRVYRGVSTLGENAYYVLGNVTTYVDTHAASSAGVPPIVNSTGNGVYPLTDNLGNTYNVLSPAAMQAEVNNTVTGAATSAANAATSATNAAASATAANTSATNAASSAASASTSAATATTQASNASSYQTSAANSATNALASQNAAATSATNAATSATAAATSATNASNSASAAASSATSANTSATNAAASATSAANTATALGAIGSLAANTILGNNTGSTSIPFGMTPAATRTLLALVASATTDTTNASNISAGTLAAARLPTVGAMNTTGWAQRDSDTSIASVIRLTQPGGASASFSGSTTGAIKIKLPVAAYKGSTMGRFRISLYNYSAGTSTDFIVSGYTYADGTWYNVSAVQIAGNTPSTYNVRFGYDSTSMAVWIGETNSSWSYVGVHVTDFQGGIGGTTDAAWGTGWAITTVTAFDTVQTTVSCPPQFTTAGGTIVGGVTINSGTSGPLTLTTSSGGPWAITLTRSDLGQSAEVYNDNGTRWAFSSRPIFNGNLPLDAGNYNTYSPTLTGGGASGTWGISITGNAATLGGYAPNASSGANTIVQRDGSGYIENSYFYTSSGGAERNASGIGYFACFNSSDYYIRSYTAAAVATAISGQSMNIAGSATTITGTYAGSLTSSQVTTALGFTPYGSSNFAYSTGATMYQKHPSGINIQAGNNGNTSTTSYTFPTAFATACIAVVCTAHLGGYTLGVASVSTTGFTISNASIGTGQLFSWIAIGY